jgi:hypothetical protein
VIGAAAGSGVLAGRVLAAGSDSGLVGPYRGELGDGTAVFSGVVEEVGQSGFTLQNAEGVSVMTSTKTSFWRDGVAELHDLREGDSVTAQGAWADDSRFVASKVEPTYFNVTGVVEALSNDAIATSGGVARLTGSTERIDDQGAVQPVRAGDLKPGTSVNVLARRERGPAPFVAVQIVVV